MRLILMVINGQPWVMYWGCSTRHTYPRSVTMALLLWSTSFSVYLPLSRSISGYVACSTRFFYYFYFTRNFLLVLWRWKKIFIRIDFPFVRIHITSQPANVLLLPSYYFSLIFIWTIVSSFYEIIYLSNNKKFPFLTITYIMSLLTMSIKSLITIFWSLWLGRSGKWN